MNKTFYFKTIFFISLLLFFISTTHNIFGQNKLNKLWSPIDKSFTLVIPIKLKNTDLYNGADKTSLNYKLIKTYEGSTPDYNFLVLVLDYGSDISKKRIEEKFEGLNFVIGGDDDDDFEEKNLKISSLNAKELTYIHQNKKGLMIDTGKQIIVLSLTGTKREYLDSGIAKEFFTSFRLS